MVWQNFIPTSHFR